MNDGGLLKWWVSHLEELGLSLAFAFGGAGMVLWTGGGAVDRRKAAMVVVGALFVDAAAVSITQGVLGWSSFYAVPVGLLCGLVGLPVLMTAIRAGRRVENRADDIADKGIDMIGKKDTQS
jgi:predicted membrane protein